MRATLTDDGCAYEGDTTHAPGPFHIEVENKTSHFAAFALKPLAAGKNAEDVRHGYEQLSAALEQGKDPYAGPYLDGLFAIGDLNWPGTETVPEATSELPVNASSGRFVIVCSVHKFDGYADVVASTAMGGHRRARLPSLWRSGGDQQGYAESITNGRREAPRCPSCRSPERAALQDAEAARFVELLGESARELAGAIAALS